MIAAGNTRPAAARQVTPECLPGHLAATSHRSDARTDGQPAWRPLLSPSGLDRAEVGPVLAGSTSAPSEVTS